MAIDEDQGGGGGRGGLSALCVFLPFCARLFASAKTARPPTRSRSNTQNKQNATPQKPTNSADILYDGPNGAWSPALTISKLCLTLRSMLASNADRSRPAGDADYCRRVGGRSPKLTQWRFDDDRV